MQALAFDKALRGTWVTDTWNLGLQPVVSIYDKTGKSTDVIHIKQITFTLPNGKTKPIDVYATGGHAMIRGIASGDDHWIPLHSTKVTFHPNVSGRERAYTHYRVPTGSACHPSHWGATGEIRMNPTGAEGAKIGEHLRALPADDERYAAIYNRRQMTESLNSWIKAQLPGRRARTYGQANQNIDMLFLGVARNTLSELHYRDRIANVTATVAVG